MLATQSLLSGFSPVLVVVSTEKITPNRSSSRNLSAISAGFLGRRRRPEVTQQLRLDFDLGQPRFPGHVNVHVDGLHQRDTLRRVRDCSALWAMIRYAETCCLDEVRSIYDGYCQKVNVLETANFVTYPDMLQLLAIFSGIWFAIFSLAVSAGVAWYIRDSNRRDRDNERRDKDHERRNQSG